MRVYTEVSRKSVKEDQIAMCPNFGCEYMKRVKPLKVKFLGFGKYPKCKKHHIPLVYVNERIVDFVDAALATLFDKAGLPPSELIDTIKSRFPNELNSFINGWIYCITAGRGAPIISRYMDTISSTYLKKLTKKQIRTLRKSSDFKLNMVHWAIREGMDEISIQYTRILKHLRVHSEILIDIQNLKSLSTNLQNILKDWIKRVLKANKVLNSPEIKGKMTLKEIKSNYDQILNVGTCRCLLGFNPESRELKRSKITAFDRFSAYLEFNNEGLANKFTKSDIKNLITNDHNIGNSQLKHKWENELKKQIESYVKILKLPNTIKLDSLKLYDNILEYLKRSFSNFYDSLGHRKAPKYTAVALIYINLRKNGQKISQKEISDNLNLPRSGITDLLSILRNFLMKMPKHIYIYDSMRLEGITVSNFEFLFLSLKNYLKADINLSLYDLEEIKSLLLKWNLDATELHVKGFKYIASTIIYIYLMFSKDQKIFQKEFTRIINDLTPLTLNYSRFSMCFSEIFKNYFWLDMIEYKLKFIKYVSQYIKHIDLPEEILDSCIDLYQTAVNKRLKKPFTSVHLNTPQINLNIVHIDRDGELHYIFPQEFALIILYYNLRRHENFNCNASVDKFTEFFEDLPSIKDAKVNFRTLIEANRVYPFIKDVLGKLKREWFSKESFIKSLTNALKDGKSPDIELILDLYLLSLKANQNLTPQDFIKSLDIYGGRLGSYYRDLVIDHKSMIHPRIFRKISKYIENNLSGTEKVEANKLFHHFIKIRREEWNTYDRKYPFQWNKANISQIDNRNLSILLQNYLKSISLGQFPLDLFLDEETDRASNLKFIAKSPDQVKTKDIRYFFHTLSGVISNNPKVIGVDKLLEKVQEIYHDPEFLTSNAHQILQDRLIKMKFGDLGKLNIIATEIPVWKKYKGYDEFMTGHIDFLFVFENYLVIADLKPRGKVEILKSIPQILAYSIMLKERLLELTEARSINFNLICLGFSNEVAWVFKPEETRKNVLKFMESKGVKTSIIKSTKKLIGFLSSSEF